jgi:hypothetical protein
LRFGNRFAKETPPPTTSRPVEADREAVMSHAAEVTRMRSPLVLLAAALADAEHGITTYYVRARRFPGLAAPLT